MPIARLHDRAVVPVSGPDAPTLLQNLLTVDLAAVDRDGLGYGALLTPQGKILFDFILHRSDDGYAFDLRAAEAEAFARRLALYRLRAKMEIGTPSEETGVVVGWDGAEADRRRDPRLAALGGRWLGPAGDEILDGEQEAWHAHRIGLAVPEGGVDFVFGDAFPHDAAMDSLHGVAFDKGCYVGQEVVSRMRHRGTARRRIVALRAARPLPGLGAAIFAGDRPVGRLGSSAHGRAIGVARLDHLRNALDAGLPVRVDDVAVEVALPDWATYGWPTAGAED